jgi:glucuronate isomerase
MAFIHEDFLLHTESARRLYHTYAAGEPILDYHCHLSPKDIAENRAFKNLFEIWLEGDHYKWRAMRANGIPERFCTGNEPPFDKFLAWARTVPHTLRNPLYHWTHLELKRYFGIEQLLDEGSATAIWERANAVLAAGAMRAQDILKKFQVKVLFTTDDPTSDLIHHRKIAKSGLETKVYPAFRPDQALNVHQTKVFNAWTDRLAAASGIDIASFGDFLSALRKRHDYFHKMGCRLSDHGLNRCYADFPSERTAAGLFAKARRGKAVTPQEQARFASFMMLYLGRLDAEKGWTKQLHLGARRNANTRLLDRLGPDTGLDSIDDGPQADALGAYLDRLDRENALPKTIVYDLNPADNYVFATMIGNFQDGSVPGKIQFGSGWWFLDQKEGIEWQINALSNTGLLSRFVGMTTDSRSFMSYPRHEYFRRVLCDMLGADIQNGELPNDEALIGQMVRRICYQNAREYFGLSA